jgi:hypothetical protein
VDLTGLVAVVPPEANGHKDDHCSEQWEPNHWVLNAQSNDQVNDDAEAVAIASATPAKSATTAAGGEALPAANASVCVENHKGNQDYG